MSNKIFLKDIENEEMKYINDHQYDRNFMNAYKPIIVKGCDAQKTKWLLMQRLKKRMQRDFKYIMGARKGVIPVVSQLSCVSEGEWERDLTRECVESNPGPSNYVMSHMDAIIETEPYFGNGFFEYCHNCENTIKLMDNDTSVIFYRYLCRCCEFEAQSMISPLCINEYQTRFTQWINNGEFLGKSFLGRHLNITGSYDKQINLIEDVGLLLFHFIRSTSNTDRCVAIVNFCKLRGMAISFVSTLLEISDSLFKPNMDNVSEDEIMHRMGFSPQGNEDTIETGFVQLRQVLNTYEKVKELPIYRKIHKFFMYLLCSGLLNGTNINFKSLQFDKFEEEAIKRTHKPGFDMVHAMLDTIVFVCEAGYDYFRTGSFDKFVHSGSSYEKWLCTAQKLKMQSKFLTNPEPHGINRFSFVSELKDSIEKGKSIVKFTGGLERGEKLFLQKTLMDLQLIEAEETTRRSAQQPRKDPFGILIHGSSHIAKSKLTEIMFKHYGKCFDLPIDDSFRYTRCPTDEYWSGFDSTQWCIVMDDIAFLAPTGEVDPTLKELLQVKNSVPYTPPQAALEDKGRTPVKAELLLATTNTKHLNLHAYFACPFAIARRLSFVVTPTIKEEYVKNGFMVDSKKIPPTPEGEYMDIWNFKVSVPMPESSVAKDNQRTRYEEIESFEDIHSFLQWFIFVAEEHAESQSKADRAAKTMAEVVVCKGCKRITKHCLCGTEWNHMYNKCGVCEKTMGNCVCVEQVDLQDFDDIFKLKLGIYAKVVQGDNLVFHQFENYIMSWKWYLLGLYLSFGSMYFSYCILSTIIFLFWFILIRYLPSILRFYYQWKLGYLWKYKLLFSYCGNEIDTWRLIFRLGGEKASKFRIQNNHLYGLALLLALPATLLSLRSLWRTYMNIKSESETVNVESFKDLPVYQDQEINTPTGRYSVIRLPDAQYGEQGNEGSVPVPLKDEKKTFYYHDPYQTTECEISGASKCSQGDVLYKLVSNNTAVFHMRFPSIGRGAHTTAVNIHGNLWLLNKHSVKVPIGELEIIWDDSSKNVSKNASGIAFSAADFVEIPSTDAVIMQVRCVSPGKSLLQYFPLDKLLEGTYKGLYIMRSKSGVSSSLQVNCIRKGSCPVFGVPGYIGTAIRPTSVGDCGSPCIVEVGTARVIFGIHTSGAPTGGVCMQHISQAMLTAIIDKFEPQVFEGTIPISAPGYERELIALHSKSPIRFLENGCAKVYGSFSGYRPKHKSKVVPTLFKDYAVLHGYKDNFGAPSMDWRPWHLAIKDMTTPVHSYLNENILKCEDAFFADIINQLGDKLSMLEVYSLDVALNGVDGVTYVDKLNCSTSAGNPFKKSKKYFLEQIDGKISSVDGIILDRVKEIESCYDNNTRFHPQFCGHLKDEPVSEKKMMNGKTRVFTGGEFAWSIVVRKYLLSHIRLIQNNPFIFEAMPGVIAQSTEWRDLYNYITTFGDDRIVAGDYGKFDKRMAAPFILSAFRILERLAQKAGWPDSDLRYIRCIAHDTAFPCIDFNGDLIEIQGNPSGHPLTVIINCLVNSLYMRYAYLLISGKPIESFQSYVKLATYGDDNIMGVSSDCPNFNHTRIAVAMKCIGVEYTMAEKEAESVPYIHIRDSSFLKRAFRYDKDIGCIVAPLDLSSFDKMMTSRLPKDDMAPEAHAICVIETAQREYFFHGKDIFDAKQKFFYQLVEDCGLQSWVRDSTFPNYYDLVYDFWMKFDDIENAVKFSLREHTPQSRVFDAITLVCGETTLNRSKVLSTKGTYELIGQTFLGRGLRVKSTCCTLAQELVSVPDPVCSVSSSSSDDEEDYNRYERLGYHLWESQSEIIADETKHTTVESTEGLISFLENQEIDHVGLPSSRVLSNVTTNTDISRFLARPVRVRSFTWLESDALGAKDNFNPWYEWANTDTIRNKLNNYSFFRGDLKLKIQISASPFYYGMALMNYRPLTSFKSDTITHASGLGWLVLQSQRPHVKIDPANGDTYEMTLPFLWPYNAINNQSASDFQGLGNLRFDIYSVLRSANGVSGSGITVTVYAWCENAELSGASCGYAAQSDEYGEGVISKPASWVANIAGRLESMPVIGSFATATRIGASAIGAIASIFGFTNVPVIADTMPFRNEAFPKLANTEIGYPIEKLTLDPKNELSVDPRIFGMPDGTDEMSIPHIVQRESFLCLSNWSTADTADTLKFATLVQPFLGVKDTITNADQWQMIPMAWLSNIFTYWRGDIVITLRVIASKYHKGKLKISYDPTGYGTSTFNLATNTNAANVTQTAILDVGENREIEFTIPYQQARQFLRTTYFTNNWTTANSTTLTHADNTDNGIFTVRVQNVLTAPVASSSVDILVFVRAGENFEFAMPDEIDPSHRQSYFAPQSDEYISEPINGKVRLGPVSQSTDKQYLVHFGEQIVSVRQLLHRFSKLYTELLSVTVAANEYARFNKVVARLPFCPGYSSVTTGYSALKQGGVGTWDYNFCEMTPLAYITNAYIGYRGGVSYCFNVATKDPTKTLRAYRTQATITSLTTTTTVVSSASALARAALSAAGSRGSALTNQLTQAGLNVVMPMFSEQKFLNTDSIMGNQPSTVDDDMLNIEGEFDFPTDTLGDNSGMITTYVASAPDFSLFYFINVPTYFIYSNFPAAA